MKMGEEGREERKGERDESEGVGSEGFETCIDFLPCKYFSPTQNFQYHIKVLFVTYIEVRLTLNNIMAFLQIFHLFIIHA